MKERIQEICNHKFTIIAVSILALGIIFLDTDLPYSFLMLIVLGGITVWANQWKWARVGIRRPMALGKMLVKAILWAIGIVVFSYVAIPILEQWFGKHDLSFFDPIRGNMMAYILLLVQIWAIVAFFEEFAFRGYLMLQWARLFGESRLGNLIALVLSSFLFGLGHNYQGITGMLLTGTIGFILGISFYRNEKNLWMPILIHGFVDTIYVTLVYTDYDIKIYEMIL